MKFPNKKERPNLNGIDASSPLTYLLDPDYQLYIESYFIERLCFERQRTERSRNPILLMLLDITRASQSEKQRVVDAIVTALSVSTRETDLKGWYKYDSIIGVLFTEISNIDVNSLKQKFDEALCNGLEQDQISKIEITLHIFPDTRDAKQTPPTMNEAFYPERPNSKSAKRLYFIMKRTIDIVGSGGCLIVFSPILVTIALMIKLSSRGPVIYRQERVGLYGKRFTLLKFRSMYVNNDSSIHREYVNSLIRGKNGHGSEGSQVDKPGIYKITHDTRVTPLGRLLRKSSLDEFPQFMNVLKGEMSLIGPRPPIPYELEQYDVWHRRRILEVRPGISGLWQVTGRSSTTFDDMVRMDLRYTKEQSLWLDLKILLRTPWVVLTGKGAH
jgi:lipopolysaccharide/colanic/teichoic acid biosynthesis glycosyltransferase